MIDAAPTTADSAITPDREAEYRQFARLLACGWLFTILGYGIADLPLRFLLKDRLHLGADAVALFFAIGHFTNYIKPLAGVLTDAVPLFGTRRRHYLLISLAACGLLWLALGVIPLTYLALLITYSIMYVAVVFISTTLGGIMAEGGDRYQASGRLSAHRVGIFRIVLVIGGYVGGKLAGLPFLLTCSIVAALHFLLIPLFYTQFREARIERGPLSSSWEALKEQGRVLVRARSLWAAAGLIFLVNAEPGFVTPLIYYQSDVLHFNKELIGGLNSIGGACGVLGAALFSRLCRRIYLRPLIVMGILIHVATVMLFLWMRSPLSAMIISGFYGFAQTVAILPLYDLCIRATPRGSEALGYSVMMSVFNIALAFADLVGAWVYGMSGFTILIFVNAGVSALVLLFIPFLPRALTDRRDGEPATDWEQIV